MDPISADPVAAAAASAAPTVPAVAVEPPPAGTVFQFVGGPLGGESRRLADDATGHVLPGGDHYELNAGRMVYVGTRLEPPAPPAAPVVAETPLGNVVLDPDRAVRVGPAGDVVDSVPPPPPATDANVAPGAALFSNPNETAPALAVGYRADVRVSVGRVVHYVLPPGSPYEGQHRAAEIVQTWAGDEVHVNLLVKKGQANDFRGGAGNFGRLTTDEFSVGGAQIVLPIILLGSCRHDEEKKEPGTWHWPERV